MKSRRDFVALGLATTATRVMCGVSNSAWIDAALRSGIAARKIPNAVGMVANGKETLYKGAFGVRDDSGAPISIDSIFAVFSMTKAVTTVAALQLVEAGKLTLDGPVSKYLPKLASPQILKGFDENGKPKLEPAETQITLRQLLTHTSGLVYDIVDANMMRFTADHPGPEAEATLLFEPGTRWLYGTGLDWTGRLVEAVSGMSLEDYFQGRILKPLEMMDTSFILQASKFDRLSSRWRRQENGTLQQADRTQPAPPHEFSGGAGLFLRRQTISALCK
jgi:methyl acetate hydrolase